MNDRVFIQEETLEIQWKYVNLKKMNTLSPELLGNFNFKKPSFAIGFFKSWP